MHYNYPQGMILLFDTACPTGWTRVSEFDNSFLCGSETYDGSGGGNTSHDHTFSPASQTTSYSLVHVSDMGDTIWSIRSGHYHPISISTTTSGPSDHIPPYLSVVFCKKD